VKLDLSQFLPLSKISNCGQGRYNEDLNVTMSAMNSSVPIAIIGMSCRFAGDVNDPEQLWHMCADGRSGWSPIPSSRFNMDAFYHPNPEKLSTVRVQSHVIDDPERSCTDIFERTLDKCARRSFSDGGRGIV